MGFVSMILTAVVVVHLYLWRRLVRASTTRGSRSRRVLTWALVVLAALLVVTFVGSRSFGMDVARVVAWPGYLWLAVMFYLFVFGLVMEVPRAVATFVVSRRRRTAETAAPDRRAEGETAPVDEVVLAGAAAGGGAPAHGPATGGRPAAEEAGPGAPVIDRRLFISRTASAVVAVGAVATVGYGVSRALGDPVIERVPIRLPRLDPRMNGLRIAVVSDIHLGPLTGRGHTERIVRMINGLEADAVAIVGDMVDGTVAELGRLAAPLKSLESRYGAYFVTGNHEYYTAAGPQEWIEELRSLGVRPLRNERVEIRHAGAVLDLAGVNDLNGAPSGDGPDFDKALGGRDANRPVVLLAHQPVQVTQAAAHGVDLQLSGHTHGGQIVPFNLLVPLQQPVVSGLASVPRAGGGDTQVYVTRGAGFWGPPVRVGAPPEITLVELHS
ncbi:membrane protein [Microbispora rosea subsp. aerata]|nr:metallophosphoesterase [Microbispora rosea]GGO26206.1 membrane protein [Microbispora rosea subsp. aerata]GIH58231.1 membrane protein [Microbispora rosea subsp. aerata]GLJ86995.1 membrane protein [Microbispora rosea subsp. aerata]